jgi:GntR family transcriptional repressor for pyruvate dehydrogenase complex
VLKRQTVTSQVIEHILGLIKNGNMQPGDKLPTEKALTENLGVSRTCVREAVKSLESLRIISVRPKVGAVLLDPSNQAFFSAESLVGAIRQEQSDALIDFRNILETGLAALAAERAQESDLAAMRQAIADHQTAMETGKPAYNADLDFHIAIARAAKNSVGMKALDMILEPLAEQRRQTNYVPGAAQDGLRDHVKILKAIEKLNPEKARRAMQAHMKTAERYLRLATANASAPASVASD